MILTNNIYVIAEIMLWILLGLMAAILVWMAINGIHQIVWWIKARKRGKKRRR